MSKSEGGQFLIDDKGVILAINPTPDELRTLISERLEKEEDGKNEISHQ